MEQTTRENRNNFGLIPLFNTMIKYNNGHVPTWEYICIQYDTMGKEVYTAFVSITAKRSDKKINEVTSEFKSQRIRFKLS